MTRFEMVVISSKGAVLPGRNDVEMQTPHTLRRITASIMKYLTN